MRGPRFFADALCLLVLSPLALYTASAAPVVPCLHEEGAEPETFSAAAAAKPAAGAGVIPAKGSVNVLAIRAGFPEDRSQPVPSFSVELFDPQRPGSAAHYYDLMSFGQLRVRGAVLPKRYFSDHPASHYLHEPGQRSRYGVFAEEILAQVDAEVDLGRFDNDGPDGIANSGDDDGRVDYAVILLPYVPDGFIRGKADGKAGLGFNRDWVSSDAGVSGDAIRVSGGIYRAAIFKEGTFDQTVGTFVHEFAHSLGLPDLYDTSFQVEPDQHPADDGAGIGAWGLLGRGGTWGPTGAEGPSPMSAWCREHLGWIGRDNDRLVEVDEDVEDLLVTDVHEGGRVYRVLLRSQVSPSLVLNQEYLLLEYRSRLSHHYNRHVPREGILVWHVNLDGNNGDETRKLVDLICADGLYRDAGWPQGKVPDPLRGRDNLDFWARDERYTAGHSGNVWDASDPFDGISFTRLDLDSNPSSAPGGRVSQARTELSLRMRREGGGVRLSVRLPRWADTIRDRVQWAGEVLVDGDVTVAPEGQLVIHDGTRVRFAGGDRLGGGDDPSRCELRVEGELVVADQPLTLQTRRGVQKRLERAGVRLEAAEPGASWYGVLVARGARVQLADGALTVLSSVNGAFHGGGEAATAVAEEPPSPVHAQLLANYPNPFNPQTTIPYHVANTQPVVVTVYNGLGQPVRTLVDAVQSPGLHTVAWDGRDESGRAASSGRYFCQLRVDGTEAQVRSMVLIR